MPTLRKIGRDSWTMAELRQLGKVPDSVLARRLHRTIKEIVAERQRRRILHARIPRDVLFAARQPALHMDRLRACLDVDDRDRSRDPDRDYGGFDEEGPDGWKAEQSHLYST